MSLGTCLHIKILIIYNGPYLSRILFASRISWHTCIRNSDFHLFIYSFATLNKHNIYLKR